MDRSINKNTQQPYIPKGSTIYKAVIPEKKPSDEIVNNLFLVIADGNYFKIKEHLFTNNVLMTSKNGSGESALHVIIKNSNITSHEKKELIQFAIMKGAQVNAYDVNNISPLHLACKYQLVDIIKLLLSYGANVNALDNNYKSPLHYATIGENVECQKEEKVKPLIPKTNAFKVNKADMTQNAQDLNLALSEFFVNDPHTAKFIKQMKSSFDNVQNMFPFKMKELQEKNKQEIIDTLINSSANDEDKKQEIFTKIMDIKTSLTEYINLQIKSSTDQMIIKSNIVSGWGPDSLQQNRILPYTSLEDFVNVVDKQLGQDRHTKILELQQLMGALGTEVNELQKYNNECDQVIGHCHVYSKAIGTIIGNNDIRQMTEIRQILCEDITDLSKMIINVPLIDKNVTYSYLTGNYKNINGVAIDPNDPTLPPVVQKFNLIDIKNPSRIRILENEVKDYIEANGGRHPKKAKLSLPMNVGGTFNTTGSVVINVNPVDDGTGNPDSVGLYFNTKIKFYTHFLDEAHLKLKRHLNTISSGIDADPNYPLPLVYEEHIAGAVTQLLNITMLLASINDSVGSLQLNFSDLHRNFDNMSPLFKPHPTYSFLIEQITDSLEYISKEDVTKMCADIYKSVRNIIKNLNGIISFMESMSASRCIDAYFKYRDFDTFYISMNSPAISNIIGNPLQKIKEFPEDLSFVNLSGENIVERRKDLIENFMMQVTLSNLPTGIINGGGRIPQRMLPTIGYLVGRNNVDIRELSIDTLDGNKIHQIKISEIGRDPTKATNPIVTLIGNISYLYSVIHNKDVFSYPIIGMFYAIFLNMLKYSIMRHTIDLSYKFLTTPLAPVGQHEAKLSAVVTRLNNEVKQIVKFDGNDYGFILTMLGRSIDKYLINFINENLSTKINELLLKMIRNTIPQHYTTLLNNVFRQVIPTAVLNPDNGLSLDMDELFDELLILHQQNLTNGLANSHAEMRDIAMITIGNLNEDYTKKKKIHKITNFDAETQTRNEICYKYDQDVINTLLEFNAKVNLKDAIGNTPLYYAIETFNILAIKELKKRGAVIYSTTSINKFGKCALEHAWDLYELQLKKQIGDKYEVCKNATEKIIQKLKKNEKYANNIPKYSFLILPMTLYMLNHQFYLTGKGYANGWNYSNNEEFETLIGSHADCILPLLDTNLDIEEFEPKSYIESAKRQVSVKTEHIVVLTQRRKSLNDELMEFNVKQRPLSHVDNLRIEQIQDAIQKIDANLLRYNNEVSTFNTQIGTTNAFSQGSKASLKQFIDRNKQHFKLHDENVTDIYNSVFIDVINYDVKPILDGQKYYYSTDMRTYPLMWKKYFQNIRANDYTQVVDDMVDFQKRLLADNLKTPLEKVRDVRIISQYHSKIINPFCEHYFELEQVYGETNYAMTKIIDIIVHVVKHTLCVNLFGFIVKALTKFMLSSMPKHQYTDKSYAHAITQLVIEIIDANKTSHDGSALMNYIFSILPLKLVKATLQIYEGPNEGEDDLDKRLTPESIFNHINKILESSTTVEIKDKSSLLSNLKEYAYPFYVDYSTSFIKEMKNLIDSYMRQLQGEFNMLNILDELSQK